MDKSRQGRTPRNNPLIIDRPDLQSWQQRIVSRLLTTVFWVLWVVLWLPVVTLAAWAFFGIQLHFHFVTLEGFQSLLDLLSRYALVIAAMGGSLLVWAKYNHLRFRGMDRRKPAAPVAIEALAQASGHDVGEVRKWQGFRVMTVSHDACGAIVRVVGMPGRPRERQREAA